LIAYQQDQKHLNEPIVTIILDLAVVCFLEILDLCQSPNTRSTFLMKRYVSNLYRVINVYLNSLRNIWEEEGQMEARRKCERENRAKKELKSG